MKRLSLEGMYEYGLLGVLFLIVLHAPISVALGTAFPHLEDLIKAWKEIALAALSVVMIILVNKNRLWRPLLRDKAIVLCGVFILLHLLTSLLFFNDIRATVAGLMIDLRFIVIFVLLFVLLRLRPSVLHRVMKVIAAGACIVIGFGVLQITVLPDDILSHLGYSKQTIAPFVTIDSNPEFVRINSTLRGPNPLGAVMVIYIGLGMAYMVRHRKREARRWKQVALAEVGSCVVLIASFSRSAYIAAILTFGVIAGLLVRLTKKRAVLIALSVASIGAVISLLSSTDWYSNVVLHQDPESSVSAKSNTGHINSLADGAKRMVTQPFGAGVGSTGSASLYDDSSSNDVIIENYYFFVAHETGWAGAIIFIALFAMLLARLWRHRANWVALGVFASGIGLAFAAVLLPVWADETVALIWWGLAGAALAASRGIMEGSHATGTRQQKTTRTP